MNRKFVLDTSVLLKYITHNKLYRLFNIIIKYSIVIYVDDTLIAELERNLPRAIKSPVVPYGEIIEAVLLLTTYAKPLALFNASPDPKDNFLFDLALQTGSEVIISDENKLLAFEDSPVPVRSLGWFKETFPIEL